MKLLRNITTSTQFLRIKYSPIYAHTFKCERGGTLSLTDEQYRLLAPISALVWVVTHVNDDLPDTNQEVETLASGTGHTHANMSILNSDTASFTTTLKSAYDNAVVTPITKLLYTDKNRADSYSPDGSALKPFKTIAAALDKIVLNGDAGSIPYSILLSSGTYAEEVNLNGRGLSNLTLAAQGRVAIVPTTGSALIANASVSALRNLHVYGIEFGKAVTITGDGTAEQFSNVNFKECAFGATATFTCMNSIALWNTYTEANLSFNNVNYIANSNGIFQGPGVTSITLNSANASPSWGTAGGINLYGVKIDLLTLSNTGWAYNVGAHSSRIGYTGYPVTIPANCAVTAYNSILRGDWTNSGTLTFRNSQAENTVAGTAPIYTANKSAYVNYTTATPALWSGSAPINVNAALERIATAVSGLLGGSIP